MAGVLLRPVERSSDLRGLAAPGRFRIDIRTKRPAGLESGPRHEPRAFAPDPGTWGGPLLQLPSPWRGAPRGRARRPSASAEDHPAEVFLRRAGLPAVCGDLPAARELPSP